MVSKKLEQLAVGAAAPVERADVDLLGGRATARLSSCGRYRYDLTRVWDPTQPLAVWVMLNPASADADNNDHTITKCIGFAKRWGAGGIRVVNLYAWRATYPGDLQLVEDPVGPDNDQALTEALTDAARNRLLVVAAWGGGHADPARARAVADLADDCGVQLRAFGTTLAGAPRHPVRLSYASELTPWSAS